jgi:hypothetical protein
MPDYTDAEVEAIVNRYKNGESTANIARTLGENRQDEENRREQDRLDEVGRRATEASRRINSGETFPPGAEPPVDPVTDTVHTFRRGIDSGMTRDEAAREGFAKLFAAAVAGDPRVAHNGPITSDVRERWAKDRQRRTLANHEAQRRSGTSR